MSAPHTPAPTAPAPTAPTHRGRRSTAAVTVLLLVLAVAATAGFLQHRRVAAQDQRALAAAEDGLEQAATDLEAVVVAGEQVLLGSEGQVADEGLRTTLADVLAEASALDTDPEGTGSRAERTRSAETRASDAVGLTATVQAATAAVAEAYASWTLAAAADGWAAARDALASSVAAAELDRDARAPGTPGRAAVVAALVPAVAARDAVVDPADVDVLSAATAEADAAREALDAAVRDAG
jgi:hypothetical protein